MSEIAKELKTQWVQNLDEIKKRFLGTMNDGMLPVKCIPGETLIISSFWTICHIVVLEGGYEFDIIRTMGREYDPNETFQVVRPAF